MPLTDSAITQIIRSILIQLAGYTAVFSCVSCDGLSSYSYIHAIPVYHKNIDVLPDSEKDIKLATWGMDGLCLFDAAFMWNNYLKNNQPESIKYSPNVHDMYWYAVDRLNRITKIPYSTINLDDPKIYTQTSPSYNYLVHYWINGVIPNAICGFFTYNSLNWGINNSLYPGGFTTPQPVIVQVEGPTPYRIEEEAPGHVVVVTGMIYDLSISSQSVLADPVRAVVVQDPNTYIKKYPGGHPSLANNLELYDDDLPHTPGGKDEIASTDVAIAVKQGASQFYNDYLDERTWHQWISIEKSNYSWAIVDPLAHIYPIVDKGTPSIDM